ncbi:Amidohydrolase-like protein 5 [Elsinoe fawcettii]|nr:Amidohydrolase-like protein 5 [Elsinoe fawcettii]
MSTSIIDSHIHLWPDSAANAHGHAWMGVVTQLAKQHVLSDYRKAAGQDRTPEHKVEGVVYVETDRRYEADKSKPLEVWAKGPLDEIKFLRSIVEGNPSETHSELLKGIVAWAPLDRGPEVFEQWLDLAKEAAGEKTWDRIKGFRFLLQAITEQKAFEELVHSQSFLDTLLAFRSGGRDLVFDVGVDAHSGGIWQLQAWAKVLEQVNGGGQSGTRFVMNHLCKPDLTESHKGVTSQTKDFETWSQCIKKYASYPKVYMKLSGAFSELSNDKVDSTDAEEIVRRIKPWTDIIFEAFGAERIMFGSDWPVCNIRGPDGEEPWQVWRRVVETILTEKNLSQERQRRIWSETAKEAYKLE